MKKKKRNLFIALLVVVGCFLFALAGYVTYQVSPTGTSNTPVTVEIPSGTTVRGIGKILKEEELIHSDFFFLVYAKLTGRDNMKASTYTFSRSMSLDEILGVLSEGNTYNPDVITLTFREGLNMTQVADLIERGTSHTKEAFLTAMEDREAIKAYLEDYWFLTDALLDDDIYYPLEGYLYPNTYQFKNKDVSIDEIVRTMLDEMGKVLEDYRSKIEKSSYTVHEMVTLASVVELEGVGDDRSGIAQVFYNRLDKGMALGSDVTACYAFHIAIKDCNDNVPYEKYNPYNTRSPKMSGKLPIGPIANPSRHSLEGAISPDGSDYLYFVADKYKQVHFTKTYQEHLQTIKEIKDKGEWPW